MICYDEQKEFIIHPAFYCSLGTHGSHKTYIFVTSFCSNSLYPHGGGVCVVLMTCICGSALTHW